MVSPPLDQPSPWVIESFGPHLAAKLRSLVPQAIAAAVRRARDAHDAAGMHTDHAFGSTWPAYFEELVNHLEPIADRPPVRPVGRFYQLVVVGGHVLFPWRYAKDPDVPIDDPRQVRPLRVLGSELLRRFGPEPRWRQDPLPLLADADEPVEVGEEHEAAAVSSVLEEMDPPPQVVIVGYAANSRAGLIHLCWGKAALADGGNLHWINHEDLPLPSPSVSES